MKKLYLAAPLPFQGQKRMFAKEYINVLNQFPENTTFVDLFGGSGLLSHIAKYHKPNATVVYNDYDGYRVRIKHIKQTNELLTQIRQITKNIPRYKPIIGAVRENILARIKNKEREDGYIDYITLSSSLLFSMKYATCYEDLEKETLYNSVKKTDYPSCEDYLNGLTITSCDYKKVFEQYKDVPGIVFLVDPPYLSTDCKTYTMSWKLSDYLDVLSILKEHNFIYFTSNKSSIVELCEWMAKNKDIGNPFEKCQRKEFKAHMNYNSSYTDIMLFKDAA